MFMVDIENFFQTKYTAHEVPQMVLTEWLAVAVTWVDGVFADAIVWMEIAY